MSCAQPLGVLRGVQFAEAVVNLKFEEEPKYQAFMTLFDPLCGPQPHRPILTDGQVKVVYPSKNFLKKHADVSTSTSLDFEISKVWSSP